MKKISKGNSYLGDVKFAAQGLGPAIVQDGLKGRILMMAWMNREALELTVKTGYAHFYSRSRKKMWMKGEESGHVQKVHEIRLDCDGDVVLLVAAQKGPGACHTGHGSCFYRKLRGGPAQRGGRWVVADKPSFDPRKVYKK